MGLDQMGNMFARREGTDPDALPVYVGSHLDTQPTGGKYDGVSGRARPGWKSSARMNESRYQDQSTQSSSPTGPTKKGRALRPPCSPRVSSRACIRRTGPMTREDAEGQRNSVMSYNADRLAWRGRGWRPQMHAFFELHIEQGPILEAEEKDIGVVTHGQGLSRWTQVTVTGKESHTGSYADADAQECRARHGADHSSWSMRSPGHTSPTRWVQPAISTCIPNSRNVIPGKVGLPWISVRHELDGHSRTWSQVRLKALGSRRKFAMRWDWRSSSEKVGGFDPVEVRRGLCGSGTRAQPSGWDIRTSEYHLGRGTRRLLDQSMSRRRQW